MATEELRAFSAPLPPPAGRSSSLHLHVNLPLEIKQIIKYRQPNLKNQNPFIVFSYIKEIQKERVGVGGASGRGQSWVKHAEQRGPVPPGPSLPTVSSPCCSRREADAILLAELTLSGRSQKPIWSRLTWAVLTGAKL